jgi:K(+)-stimulated pyrophosphate-energized sodium pump
MESTAGPALVIAGCLAGSHALGEAAGLPHGGGLFGTAAATMGMLGTAASLQLLTT